MDVHLIQAGAVGRKEELLSGMAGQRRDLFQRYLDEVRGFVRLADELGYAGYGHNEHHLQIEGFEATNHPGMFSQFIGNNSSRLRVNTLGYVAPTHNPVRAAEEIAMLDHMLQGRLAVGFVRGYQDRWVANYAAVPGAHATTPDNAKRKDHQDAINRAIFEESVRIVKKAWTEPTFSYEGEFWTFPPKDLYQQHPIYNDCGAGVEPDGHVLQIGIAPHPYQDPHPPLYGAFAHSLRTIKFWAREGGKPIVLANDLDFAEMLWNAYAEEAEARRPGGGPGEHRRLGRPPRGQRGPRCSRAPDRAALVVLRRLVRSVQPGPPDADHGHARRGHPHHHRRPRPPGLQRAAPADRPGLPGAGGGGGQPPTVRREGDAPPALSAAAAVPPGP